MRILQRISWKRRLGPAEKLLWYGAEARAFGMSSFPVLIPLILTAGLGTLISRDMDHIPPLRVYGGLGAFFFGAWLFIELVFFTGISFYAITDRRIMERCLFRITEIRFSDIDYIGAGGMMRHMSAFRSETAQADFSVPEVPENFAVGAGDTEIVLAVKDPAEPAGIIREIMSGCEPQRSKENGTEYL